MGLSARHAAGAACRSTASSSAPAPTAASRTCARAAKVAKGRKAVIPAWVVAGSGLVKKQAEAEGLDKIFRDGRLRLARAGLLDVRRRERRHRHARPAHRLDLQPQLRRPPGARACARTSSARRWPPPRPSPATSPTCAGCWARRHTLERLHHARPPSPSRSTRPTSTPTRSFRRASWASCAGTRSAAIFHDLRLDAQRTATSGGRDRSTSRRTRTRRSSWPNYNFACGSSRENAVTVMVDNGFRAFIAPSLRRHLLQQLLPERRACRSASSRRGWRGIQVILHAAARRQRSRSILPRRRWSGPTARPTASRSIPSARTAC